MKCLKMEERNKLYVVVAASKDVHLINLALVPGQQPEILIG